MSQAPGNRRGFLRSIAAVAAGSACASFGSSAHAITARPSSDYGAVLESACGQAGYHARIVKETEEALGMTSTDPRFLAILQQVKCPMCGCPVLPAPLSGAQSPF